MRIAKLASKRSFLINIIELILMKMKNKKEKFRKKEILMFIYIYLPALFLLYLMIIEFDKICANILSSQALAVLVNSKFCYNRHSLHIIKALNNIKKYY